MSKHRKILLAILIVASWGCEAEDGEDGTGNRPSTIIDGKETKYESWQGVLMVSNLFWSCSGILIHPKVVLTAGHCVTMYNETLGFNYDFSITPRAIRISGGDMGQTVYSRGSKISVHPSWSGKLSEDSGDLAMILLEDAVVEWEPYRLRDFPMPAPSCFA